jgi:hypothetical protein
MAIFASTTLGTGDPSRAMNIKALEARAQALAAAQSKQEMPTSMPSPWQGAGYLANTVADAVATKRADQQAAEQKQQLAALMGQVGPEGPNPQQLAGITARDTDLGKMYATQAFQSRQNAADIAARKEMAAEKYKQDEAAAVAQEERLKARPPNDDLINLKRGLQQGILTQEEYDARVKKLNAPPPAEQKLIGEQQSANIDLQASGQDLDKALELLDTGKVYSNSGLAGLRTEHGQSVPKVLQGITGVDPESTDISKRYSQLMKTQVLPILNKLKGSMSNADREWAVATIDNPSSTVEAKKDVIRRLKTHLDAELKQSNINLKNTGATAVQVGQPATAAPGQPTTAAPAVGATAAPAADPLEGRTATSSDGKTKMVRRNGKWEPM